MWAGVKNDGGWCAGDSGTNHAVVKQTATARTELKRNGGLFGLRVVRVKTSASPQLIELG